MGDTAHAASRAITESGQEFLGPERLSVNRNHCRTWNIRRMPAVITDFFGLLVSLLQQYFLDAWPFMVLHAGLGYVVVRDLREVAATCRHLETYRSAPTSTKDELATQDTLVSAIRQFERQARKLGKKGFVTPMTDFSDRLDAEVDQKIGRINDFVGLLLVVGIAGTMFGVFEFAFQAQDVIGGAGASATVDLSKFLAESMAKAFPVGFMGLVWMLIGQFYSARYEHQLQTQVSKTSLHVLAGRSEAATSQSEHVQEAVDEVKGVATRIETALEPIQGLKATIKDGVTPIVRELGERLDESVAVVREQSTQMQTTSEKVQATLETVLKDTKTVVRAMREETTQLKQYLEGIPDVVAQTEQLQSDQKALLTRIRETRQRLTDLLSTVEEVSNGVRTTTASLESVPKRIEKANQKAVSAAQRQAKDVWEKNFESLQQGLRDVHTDHLAQIRQHTRRLEEQSTKIPAGFEEAATHLGNVTRTMKRTLTEVFKEAVDDALDRAEGQVDEKLLSRYPDAVQHAEALTEVLESLANRLEGTQEALDKTLEKKKDVAEEIRAVEQDGRSVFAEPIDHAAGGIQKKADEILSEIRYLRRVAAATDDAPADDDPTSNAPPPQPDSENERLKRSGKKEHDGVGGIGTHKNADSGNSLRARGSDDDSGPSGNEPLDKGKRESGSEREPAGVSGQRPSRSAQGTRNRDVDTEGQVTRTSGSADEVPVQGSDLGDDSDADTSPPGRATQKTGRGSSSGKSSAGSTTETSSKERETDAESPDSSAPSRSRSWDRNTETQDRQDSTQADQPQADQSSTVRSTPTARRKENDMSRADDPPDVAEEATQNNDDTSSTVRPQEGMADENDDPDDSQTHSDPRPTDPHDSDGEEERSDGEEEGRASQSVSEEAKKEQKSLLSRIKEAFGFG